MSVSEKRGIFWGLMILIFGILFLAHNLGFLSYEVWSLWPLILIILGIKKLLF
jgi:hypothetical protein